MSDSPGPMHDADRLAEVSRTVVRDCAGVRAGENVVIEGRADSLEYLECLAFECELLGAYPVIVALRDEYRHRRLVELPEEQLAAANEGLVEALRAADVVFTVRLEDGRPQLFRDVPDTRRVAALKGRKWLSDVIYDGSRRWIGTDLPTPQQAEALGLGFAGFCDMFWRSLQIDYRQLARRADAVAAVLDGASEVRVTTARGTDVRLRIDGRPLQRDVGMVTDQDPLGNLPAGEVCLAPHEDGADGTVVVERAFWKGVCIEDLEVVFDGGVARPVRAASGLATFSATLAGAGGDADRVGELGIGLNPGIGEPCGYVLTDEKILGTVHLAVGENRMLGGTNESSLHWDLVVTDPTVRVDGRPLMVDGRLAV